MSGERNGYSMKAFVIAREKIVDFMKMDMVQPETEECCICRRGEVLPFQILAEGSGEIIQEIHWEDFSDGKGNIIPGKTGRTISLQMRDDTGNDYNVEKTVEGRTVLWAYIEIPMGIPGGQYKGRLQVICKGGEDCGVVCRIEVKEEAAVNCGYDDVSALSRIKWFRSRKGLAPVIPEPFIPLQWDGWHPGTADCNRREWTPGRDFHLF